VSASPSFAQAERRSFALPIVLALAVLALAGAVVLHLYPRGNVALTLLHTDTLPTHTVFKSDSIVVGPAQTSDVLFVTSTIRVENRTRNPITLDDFSCTYTDPAGAVLTVKASTRPELVNQEISFPRLKPLASAMLLRDHVLVPGKSAQGTLVFSFPFTPAQWAARKSATIQMDVYHGDSLTLVLPK
jgi:hypothetical protein